MATLHSNPAEVIRQRHTGHILAQPARLTHPDRHKGRPTHRGRVYDVHPLDTR